MEAESSHKTITINILLFYNDLVMKEIDIIEYNVNTQV
jgi:hypothetical protein